MADQRDHPPLRRSNAGFLGCDAVAFEGFVLGSAGWVAAIANVCAAEHMRLYRLLECKDYAAARDYFYRLLPLFSLFEHSGKFTQFVKAGCTLAGRDAGPPRRPLLPPNAEELESLRAVLKSNVNQIGFQTMPIQIIARCSWRAFRN